MLIAMAGLPGTGKTVVAARLAAALGGVVLNKDDVRATLFPEPALDYSRAQDDLTMTAVYSAAVHIRRTRPAVPVVIDGRTFSRSYQLADLAAATAGLGEVVHLIECVCSDAVVHGRLDADRVAGRHPAANRTFALYLERKAAADPIAAPRLVLDTTSATADGCVAACLRHLGRG